MPPACSPAYSIVFQIRLPNRPGMLAEVVTAIGTAGGDVGVINIVDETREFLTRDITVRAQDTRHQRQIIEAVDALSAVTVLRVEDAVFACHRGGKIRISNRVPVDNAADLARVYTPGVARICRAIAEDPRRGYRLTTKCNTVAVVTDGSAILGLGDLGPLAAMPVMEGKAMLFRGFAEVDAIPICLGTQDVDEIVNTVIGMAPTFGGINLEDISAPRCFEIERRLQAALDIPVFHDDQHGTAIVTLAALLNASKVVDKPLATLRVVFNGVGAAGVACTKLLMAAGVEDIVGCDRRGAIYAGRTENMNPAKEWYAENTNSRGLRGKLSDVIESADVFVGLSGPDTLTVTDVRRMADGAIVMAMSNPDPEIQPEKIEGIAAVIATGRSDYPNQINNVLAFPGVFRGALDCRACRVTERMKLAAAHAIAGTLDQRDLTPDRIIPSPFDPRVVPAVAAQVAEAARKDGVSAPVGEHIEGVDDLMS